MRMRQRPWTCNDARPKRVLPEEPASQTQEYGELGLYSVPQAHLRPNSVYLNRSQHPQNQLYQRPNHPRYLETVSESVNIGQQYFPGRYSRNISPTRRDRREGYRTFINGKAGLKYNLCSSLWNQDPSKGISSLFVSRKLLHQNSVPSRSVSVMTKNDTSLLTSRSKERKRYSGSAETGLKNCKISQNSKKNGLVVQDIKDTSKKVVPNDDVKICERNHYRTINETIYELNFDKVKEDGGSVVTFNILDDERKSVVHSQNSSDDCSLGMSTTDLPPISTRGDKRKISSNSVTSTGAKTTIIQQPSSANILNSYSRRSSTDTADSFQEGTARMSGGLTKKRNLLACKNFSESSLANLVARSPSQSRGSGSIPTSWGTLQTKDVVNGRADSKHRHLTEYTTSSSSHRARSLGATDTSDSQVRLETLFEGQNYASDNFNNNSGSFNVNRNLDNKNSFNQRVIANKRTDNNNVIVNRSCNKSRTVKNINTAMPSIARPVSSVTVGEARNLETISRHLKTLNKNSVKYNFGDVKVDKVTKVASSTAKGKMVRSNSENKLNERTITYSTSNKTHAGNDRPSRQQAISRHKSVDLPERQRSKSQQRSRGVTNSKPHENGSFNIRRFNSVSNIYNGDTPLQDNDFEDPKEVNDDDDSLDTSSRLVEWLQVVNNVDRYDTDPRDEVVEYCDEPPQTDTAIHVVYEGD